MVEERHFKAELETYLSGGLTDDQRRQIDEHMAQCDRCRQGLNKARSKHARLKREALKSALPDKVPNLFLTRLGKQSTIAQARRSWPWGWIAAIFVLLSVAFVAYKQDVPNRLSGFTASVLHRAPANGALSNDESAKAGTAAPFEVRQTPTAPVAGEPAVQAPAISTPTQAAEAPAAPPSPPPGEAYPGFRGTTTAIKEYRKEVIRGRSSWRSLWEELAQTGPPPRINFYNNMVVGVVAGDHPGGDLSVGPVRDEAAGVQIPVTIRSTPPSAGAAPFEFLVIPRTEKRITFVTE